MTKAKIIKNEGERSLYIYIPCTTGKEPKMRAGQQIWVGITQNVFLSLPEFSHGGIGETSALKMVMTATNSSHDSNDLSYLWCPPLVPTGRFDNKNIDQRGTSLPGREGVGCLPLVLYTVHYREIINYVHRPYHRKYTSPTALSWMYPSTHCTLAKKYFSYKLTKNIYSSETTNFDRTLYFNYFVLDRYI